jgi:uncharacterized membrane protein
MATNINQEEWNNSANWRGGWLDLYVAPNDSRVWVPKRRGIGWTLNFAYRISYVYIVLLLLSPMIFVLAWAAMES